MVEHLQTSERMMTLLYEAMTQYGLREIPGPQHESQILKFSKELGYPFDTDEVSWCGIFMSAMCKRAGLVYPDKGYSARSWLKWGDAVDVPVTGDVVVFWRVSPNSWQGHVGIFVNYTKGGDFINVLGGNQSNKVGVNAYDASKVLGFRRL